MSFLRSVWHRFYGPVLLILALGATFIWGVNLGRRLGPTSTAPQPAATARVAPSMPTPTPTGEYVAQISADTPLDISLDPPPAESTPADDPRLRVRVDIRDAVTEQPVRAEVWLTTIVGDESDEQRIRADTSLVEFPLPGPDEADEVFIKVQAPGYRLWIIGLRHQVEFDRVLPLPVLLEPIDDSGNG
ncbi:MAG: hypothetical protein R3264_08475 [Anaerolineae bacterium]|nr:hypothetical protein [Anaerolineae bacterium]